MPIQKSGSISTTDIANEFGYSLGSTNGMKIGDYRGQNFTNSNNNSVRIPTSEDVPTSGPIKFSDFYGGRLTFVVDYFSGPGENKPQDAYTRFDNQVQKTVVSGFKQVTSNNTAGKRVVILVNKDIGSDKTTTDSCALRTGNSWNSDTVMQVLLGPDGEVLGAGGDGGNQQTGTSGLGVQFEGVASTAAPAGATSVVIQSGGRIAGGGGGGGSGGSAWAEERTFGNGRQCAAGRGGGGGGAGLPTGIGAAGGGSSGSSRNFSRGPTRNATSGGNGNTTTGVGGAGGEGGFAHTGADSRRYAYCYGGDGGNGGNFGSPGTDGANATLGGDYERRESGTNARLRGGAGGAAIRRTVTTIVITNLGPPSQLVGDTTATGIT